MKAAGPGPPLTEQAKDIDSIWTVFLIGSIAVAALVTVLVLYVVIRFRRRSDVLPRQRRELIPLEVTYTVVPLMIIAALFAVTFVSTQAIDEIKDDPDLVVDVTGFQWSWRFSYPDRGVEVVGTEDEIPELVLPTGARVQFDVTSIDVVHSFWIPGFRFKRDMFPGQIQTFQVDIGDETGSFPNTGVCAEFCGLDHWKMRFSVRVVTPDEFTAWVEETS